MNDVCLRAECPGRPDTWPKLHSFLTNCVHDRLQMITFRMYRRQAHVTPSPTVLHLGFKQLYGLEEDAAATQRRMGAADTLIIAPSGPDAATQAV
ncbi:hypothetical protein ABPG77_003518 [Micractinium sp. CCAP 211/92]